MNPNPLCELTWRDTLASFLILTLLLPSTWGCALFRDPIPPGFDTISIQVEVERDKKGSIEGDLRAYSTLKGVLVGALTGAPSFAIAGGAGGLGVGVVTCSATFIFYPFCVAGTVFVGFVGGAIVGLVGGVTIGIIGGLPSEVAKQTTAALARMEENRSFDEDLMTAMRNAIPQEKQLDSADAMAIVTARLEEFDLRQHSKDRLSVRLSASMVQTWQVPGEKRKEKICDYRYDSEKKDATTWLADSGVAFRESVTLGIETFARWMNRDLEAFATTTELEETEQDPASCFKERHWYNLF